MKCRITTWAAAGFAGLYCCMVTSSHGNAAAPHTKSMLVNDCLLVLADLKIVSDDYAVHIVDTAHKVRAKKVDWQVGLKLVNTARGQIQARWTTYHGGDLDNRERALADTANDLMKVADKATDELTTIFKAQDKPALDQFVTEKLYETIDPVTTAVSQILDYKIVQCASFGSARVN